MFGVHSLQLAGGRRLHNACSVKSDFGVRRFPSTNRRRFCLRGDRQRSCDHYELRRVQSAIVLHTHLSGEVVTSVGFESRGWSPSDVIKFRVEYQAGNDTL